MVLCRGSVGGVRLGEVQVLNGGASSTLGLEGELNQQETNIGAASKNEKPDILEAKQRKQSKK